MFSILFTLLWDWNKFNWSAPHPRFLRPCSCVETRNMTKFVVIVVQEENSSAMKLRKGFISLLLFWKIVYLFILHIAILDYTDEIRRKQFFRQIAKFCFEFLSFNIFHVKSIHFNANPVTNPNNDCSTMVGLLKSVHFKNPVARSSFLTKLWSFSI